MMWFELFIPFASVPEAIAGNRTVWWPPVGHKMMTGGGWGIVMGQAEELQPPFASSSWFVQIQRQFLLLSAVTQRANTVSKNGFRSDSDIRNALSDVTVKAVLMIKS
eukprot:scaffold69270_cov22-Cyclotella_meneghiniana.AAC.3